MNNKIKYIAGTAFLLATLLIVSCKGMVSQKNEEPSSQDEKTYLTLQVNNRRQTYRTLAYDKNQAFEIEKFTDFVLVGKYENEEEKIFLRLQATVTFHKKLRLRADNGNFLFMQNTTI